MFQRGTFGQLDVPLPLRGMVFSQLPTDSPASVVPILPVLGKGDEEEVVHTCSNQFCSTCSTSHCPICGVCDTINRGK